MHPVSTRGRRIWGLVGLATAASLAIPGVWLISFAGVHHGSAPPDTITRTVTVSQPVTTVNVQSNGAPVQVTAGPGQRVRVTETIVYGPWDGRPPTALQSVSGGVLTLAEPMCDCTVSFSITIPLGVGVAADTQGGPLTISGASGANLDSGGGPVSASGISGHLIVSADGGAVELSGLTGPLDANTGGGPLSATGIDATAVTVLTGGGRAQIGFTAPPDGMFISTDGGPATLSVPGGPYALTANTYGGPETVGIATDPAVGRSITVTTGGGPLQIEP